MKNDYPNNQSQYNDGRFSRFWFEIIQTRIVLISVLILFLAIEKGADVRLILVEILIYALLNCAMGFLKLRTLRFKRVRIIPDLLDIAFISCVIHATGGGDSVWFLFYLFPVISSARYLGRGGCLTLSALSISAYWLLNFKSGSSDPVFFAIKSMFLLSVAAAAINLTRAKRIEDMDLLDVFEEIDVAILSDFEIEEVLRLVLNRAVLLTASDLGQIILDSTPKTELKIITTGGLSSDFAERIGRLTANESAKAVQLLKPVSRNRLAKIQHMSIGDPGGRDSLIPKSSLCVPLVLDNKAIGTITVYSRKSFHYAKREASTLSSFAHLIAIAQKTAQLYRENVASAHASANLMESYQYLHQLVLYAPVPIIVLDENGHTEIFNVASQELWGWTSDEVKVGSVHDYYDSHQTADAVSKSLMASEGNRIVDREVMIKTKTGDLIPVSVSASVLFDSEEKKIIGSMGVFKDLRETRRLQQIEKLAAIGRIAHITGHEIKHDIGTVRNYIETLHYQSPDDKELSAIYVNCLDALRDAVEKLQNMLLATKSRPVVMDIISIEEIFEGIDRMQREANARHITFSIDYPSSIKLKADSVQIRQVLSNLFTNSLAAIEVRCRSAPSSEPGQIIVNAEVCKKTLHLYWTDNGGGIPRESSQSIFAPFFTTKETGSGLGLFISRQIIETHGGHIAFTSKEGQSTRFSIDLPIYNESVEAEAD